MQDATSPAELTSWNYNETGAREAIEAFVRGIENDGVDASERIAVFDNDGTLWSEKPNYFQADFVQYRKNLGQSVTEESMEVYHQAVLDWLQTAKHPTEGCLYTDLIYQPMLELLNYLRAHDFKTYIVSGGGIEFVRPWAEAAYGIPPEQVIGSNVRTAFRDDPPTIVRLPEPQNVAEEPKKLFYEQALFLDDKFGKPVGINAHIGRRPLAAFGNSDGDKQMLQWTTSGPGRRFGLLIHHTDKNREWQYDEPSDEGQLTQGTLDEAAAKGWTVVDMEKDWAHVSPPFPTADGTSV